MRPLLENSTACQKPVHMHKPRQWECIHSGCPFHDEIAKIALTGQSAACSQARLSREGHSNVSSPRGLIACDLGPRAEGPWVHIDIYGQFDPGSGRTLAACFTHASRAERPFGVLERRTGE